MFHVDWQQVAADPVLQQLRDLSGSGGDPSDEQLRPLVASVIANTGGLAVANSDWSESKRASVCRKLLHEAVGALLCRKRNHRPARPGCDLGAGGAGLDRLLENRARVRANSASESTLLPLPVLGPITAGRTISERRSGGSFRSATEVADRVSGVSDSGAQRLALFLDFSTELPASPPFSADFSKDFGTLINLRPEDEAPERLLCALEELATFCADWPHPATRGNYRRAELPSGHKEKLPATDVSDHVEVLEDSTYYHRLKDLLDSASSRIDLAMFFISYTGASHPSKVLLQRLADRHDDGVAVRVIVDRDDEDDPYGSRVINQPAIQFLKNRGVAVKTDKTTNLLHSKFVVIDDSRVVIGSHNWTAGSYFRYHDASLSILSNAFAAEVSQRFEMLWSEGEEA